MKGALAAVRLVLLTYLLAFAWFYPSVMTISDEVSYMRQGAAFARGDARIVLVDPEIGANVSVLPSNYPPGTSALMAPFMVLFGWRGGFLLGPASLCFCVLMLAYWLKREGRSPLFALFMLAYPPTMVMSRAGMSDLPAAALVVLGLRCFWRIPPSRRWITGFLAGLSLLLRPTIVVLFAFFFLDALLRRERGTVSLFAGGLCGAVVALGVNTLLFDNPFFVNYSGFSLSAAARNASVYLTALLVFIPGGLVFAVLYKGDRRSALIATVAAFLGLHLVYGYNAADSGGLKQVVLASRLLIPLLPVIILAMAEAVPRLWTQVLPGTVKFASARQHLAKLAAVVLIFGSGAEAVAVHWVHADWSEEQHAILVALYAGTEAGIPIVTNDEATAKYFNELQVKDFGPRVTVGLRRGTTGQISALLRRYGRVQVAVLLRRDSPYWRDRSDRYAKFIAELARDFDVRLISTKEVSAAESVVCYEIHPAPARL